LEERDPLYQRQLLAGSRLVRRNIAEIDPDARGRRADADPEGPVFGGLFNGLSNSGKPALR